ncbi:hypothetical protein BJ138DRAFT_1214535 [Hygrophoropsis aurantiaca]|uniref:Uncharacterized protein n=1 Tax=Hygrophoropsis aurantiaca TaxID=72124 RepID=A0ACB8AN25_9AGAM|nr:hypothetical protein BJ138DRAFT_1214535 [Hygrophoropsis aurantiaca]
MFYHLESATMNEMLEDDIKDIRETIYVGIVGFTVLIWDHLITFDDEIELIWQGKKGLLVYLFLLNRYITPLGFIINMVAYTLPSWPKSTFVINVSCKREVRSLIILYRCSHFVRYEGAMTVIGIQIAGLMMFIRVRAMYTNKKFVLFSVAFLFAIWTAVTGWLLASATATRAKQTVSGLFALVLKMLCVCKPLIFPSYLKACTMVFNSKPTMMASASAWLPLLYDTVVFSLTLKATVPSIRNKQTGHVFRTLLANGLLYYSVICTVNLVLTIMILQAPEGLKNISAQLELLLTVAMMSRITLNLRKQALYGPTPSNTRDDVVFYPLSFARPQTYSNASIGSFHTRPGSSLSLSIPPPSYHSRAGSSSSTSNAQPSITRKHDPIRHARPRLSTIFSATSTPYARSPVDELSQERYEMENQETNGSESNIETQPGRAGNVYCEPACGV